MRILLVKLGAIGDVVHTLPALAALRRAYPQAKLAWAVERGGAAKLLADNPLLDELIELDMRGWRKVLWRPATWQAINQAAQRLRAAKFDVALDFQGLLKSGLVARVSGAPRRLGFAREALREPFSAHWHTEHVPVDDRGHIINKNLSLVAALGVAVPTAVPTGGYEFPLALSAADEQFAAAQSRQPFVILNPGGGWPTKLWNAAGFAGIADRLWQAHGLRSLITYGPGELALAQTIATQAQSGQAQLVDASLKQFFALAKRARLFLGGDTGPMHLAAAAGTPIVTFFGPTSAARNGPFDPADVVVERTDLACRTDCYRRACSHTSCMNLPLEQMWQAVQQRLHATRGNG